MRRKNIYNFQVVHLRGRMYNLVATHLAPSAASECTAAEGYDQPLPHSSNLLLTVQKPRSHITFTCMGPSSQSLLETHHLQCPCQVLNRTEPLSCWELERVPPLWRETQNKGPSNTSWRMTAAGWKQHRARALGLDRGQWEETGSNLATLAVWPRTRHIAFLGLTLNICQFSAVDHLLAKVSLSPDPPVICIPPT